MTPCPCCGGEAESWLPGLIRCRACGLVFRTKNNFGAPVYEPGTEAEVYGSAKKDLFDAALSFLGRGPGGKLLDIGCAGGELLKAAAARGWRAEGVEIEPLLAAKAAGAGFKVHVKPLEFCALETGAYDAVTAFEVLSQADSPGAAAREAYRLLRPGGFIYIREFNASFHMPLYRLELAGFFSPLGARPAVVHNFNFTPRSLRALLERSGFKEVRIRNSRPTAGDPYRTGGFLGGPLTGLLKFLYYTLAQALWGVSLGRAYAGSSLIVTARKPRQD